MTQSTRTYYFIEYTFEGKNYETATYPHENPIERAMSITKAGATITAITMQKIPTAEPKSPYIKVIKGDRGFGKTLLAQEELLGELAEYRELGTVEQIRELKKQISNIKYELD